MSAAAATITGVIALEVARKRANAEREAAAMQKTSTDAALIYAKQQDAYKQTTEANRYGQMQRQTAPYRSAGLAANRREAELLGLPAPTGDSDAPSYPTQPVPGLPGTDRTPAPDSALARWQHVRAHLLGAGVDPSQLPEVPPGATAAESGPTGQQGAPAQQAGDLVLLQAPDGSTKRVPASEKDHWLSLGAKVVG